MIARHGDVHQAANSYLAIPNNRRWNRSANRYYARFRRVDDRRKLLDAEHPKVRDRERRAGILVRLKLFRTGLCREVFDLAGYLAKSFKIRAPNNRRDQAFVDRDCNADVGLSVKANVLVLI